MQSKILLWALMSTTLLSFNVYASSNSTLLATSYKDLPAWETDTHQGSFFAFKQSCIALIHTHSFKSICDQANALPESLNNQEATRFFEANFSPYEIVDPISHTDQGLFTGYYEPSYPASFTMTSEFSTPIYGKPYDYKNALKNHSLPTREEIAHGKSQNFAPVIAYVRNRVDRFFLQIQGSGILVFPDGKEILMGYAGENGYPYEPIGKDLVAMGEIPKKNISMQTIQEWLYEHPSRVDEVLNLDPSFVFFRPLDLNEPLGAEGVELTPNNSIAVDTSFTPLGTPVYIDTYYPELSQNTVVTGKPLRHLFIAQDVGGAIKNPIRADVFFGTGYQAEWMAGHMQSPGKMWVLLPKNHLPGASTLQQA